MKILIQFYQRVFSPRSVLRGYYSFQCRFTPSCSEYSSLALEKFGALKGIMKSCWRIIRCGPWGKGGIDLP